MVLGFWRLTRNRYGRRLYDRLARIGVRFATLEIYSRPLDGATYEHGSLPAGVRVAVDRADGVQSVDPPAAVRGDDRVVTARLDGSIVGRVFVTHGRSVFVPPLEADIDPDGAYCWRLAVSRAHRRRGIATALLARAVSVASETGANAAHALIAVDNVPSKRAFAACGFDSRGVITHGRIGPWKRRRLRTDSGRPPIRIVRDATE